MRFLVVVCFASACGGGSSPCDQLGACCAALADTQAASCRAQLQGASDSQCQAALDALREQGTCARSPGGGTGSSGGGTGSSGGSTGSSGGTSQQPDICAHYVSCTIAVTPAGAAAILAAYGPEGSCWSSSAAVAADCVSACKQGLAGLRDSNVACRCHGDDECAGATPACDSVSGECVACNADAQCAAGVCDTAGHQCVTCTSDAQCGNTSNRPHCDPDHHLCVACTSGSQCPSGVCSSNDTCCVRETSCRSDENCGSEADGCGGYINCGTCSVGTCVSHVCSTVGNDCTPGTSVCAPGESCVFDGWHLAYKCAFGGPNAASCVEGADCEVVYANGQPIEPYQCVGGRCYQNCLTQSDCTTGTCTGRFSMPISSQNPGYCG